ncbi:MAG: hypothetical protein R3E95_18080 [Thiolinea sp.]
MNGFQKIHRDHAERGYGDVIVDTIMRHAPDYINHITPQFSPISISSAYRRWTLPTRLLPATFLPRMKALW